MSKSTSSSKEVIHLILETIVGGGVAYYLLKNVVQVKLRTSPVAKAFGKAHNAATEFCAGVRDEMAAQRQHNSIKQSAGDAMLAQVLQQATPEERAELLALLSKYNPQS